MSRRSNREKWSRKWISSSRSTKYWCSLRGRWTSWLLISFSRRMATRPPRSSALWRNLRLRSTKKQAPKINSNFWSLISIKRVGDLFIYLRLCCSWPVVLVIILTPKRLDHRSRAKSLSFFQNDFILLIVDDKLIKKWYRITNLLVHLLGLLPSRSIEKQQPFCQK